MWATMHVYVRIFSLLGEEGEGVVFSRPLRVKGPARGVSASCMTLADPQTEAGKPMRDMWLMGLAWAYKTIN